MTGTQRRIAIIGGTAAGPAAAAEASRTDPNADITLFEAGPHISWGVCELPMLLSGEIERADDLLVFEPEQFTARYGVKVETGTRVDSIVPDSLALTIRSSTGQVSTRQFDAVVLATGTRAVIPEGLTTDAPNVTLLRSISDARGMREQLGHHDVHHAVVIGGGYLGIEAAEALHIQGVRVTLLQRGKRLMGRALGDDLARVLYDRLTRAGITVRFEAASTFDIRTDGRVQAVRTATGEQIGCQAVVLGAGVAPNTDLAREAGLSLGEYEAIAVDERLATSARGVWACGDCIEQRDPVTGRKVWVPLALPAYRSGHVAGRNAARRGRGAAASMKPVVPVYGLRVFDTEVAVVGVDSEDLRAAGLDPVDVTVNQVSRASLLEHDRIHLTLTADRSTGRLLGGRLVGGPGTALRANALSMAVRLGATADDLYDLDTVYTPRIAPMHDVLTVAGRAMQKALRDGGRTPMNRALERKPGETAGPSYRLSAARELDRVEKDESFVGFSRRGRGGDPAFERSVTDVVAGVTRLRRRLDFLINSFYRGNPAGLETGVRTVLRIGLYELMFTRTPDHAAINEAVDTVRVYVHPRVTGLVNGILRTASRSMDNLPAPGTGDRVRDLGILHSHPDWIVGRWIARYGEESAVRLMEHDNRRPTHGVHVRSDRAAVEEALREAGVEWEVSPLVKDVIRLDSVQPLVRSGLLGRGDVRVQDEAAVMVVRVLDPGDGERILDVCAAPGGKTLLAAETAPGAIVTASDLHEGRLELVRTSAERAGLENVVLRVMDARTPDTDMEGTFDRVLVDAPCSGLGVLSRRADLRWRRTEQDIDELITLQDAILDGAARCVAPGGLLVYATCTLEPEENGERVAAFLNRNGNFRRESCAPFLPKRLVDADGDYLSLPFDTGMDGAYAARLRRVGGPAASEDDPSVVADSTSDSTADSTRGASGISASG